MSMRDSYPWLMLARELRLDYGVVLWAATHAMARDPLSSPDEALRAWMRLDYAQRQRVSETWREEQARRRART